MTGTTEDKGIKSKKDRKKKIMCFKCKKSSHYLNKCPNEGEEKVKNGSRFLVLNTQDSSDDKTELTINHDHLVAVQENDSCDEDSDEDVEDKIQRTMKTQKLNLRMIMADLLSHSKMYYALFKTKQASWAVESCWTAN